MDIYIDAAKFAHEIYKHHPDSNIFEVVVKFVDVRETIGKDEIFCKLHDNVISFYDSKDSTTEIESMNVVDVTSEMLMWLHHGGVNKLLTLILDNYQKQKDTTD